MEIEDIGPEVNLEQMGYGGNKPLEEGVSCSIQENPCSSTSDMSKSHSDEKLWKKTENLSN